MNPAITEIEESILRYASESISSAYAAGYTDGFSAGKDALYRIANVTEASLKRATKEQIISWVRRELEALEKKEPEQ